MTKGPMGILPAWLFWAKSEAAGRPHSLLGHLQDSAAVAELVWDEFVAPHGQRLLDSCTGGRGRELLVLLAGWHDLGKASPAFQVKQPALCGALRSGGLACPDTPRAGWKSTWHGPVGALIVEELMEELGWDAPWLPAIVQGHHGRFEVLPRRQLARTAFSGAGDRAWQRCQHGVAREVASRLGIPLEGWRLDPSPSRGVQLALAGLVSMCDWIASTEDLFPGLGLEDSTMETSRTRAKAAWESLALDHGWAPETLMRADGFDARFGMEPRPLQRVVTEIAEGAPELLVIEAPMGEGKTEAAFAAAEILGRAHGCSGFVLAMPTQGTTDAMYERVRAWTGAIDTSLSVALLHGKAMLNETWQTAREDRRVVGIFDEFGMEDPYGTTAVSGGVAPAPSNWLLGRHRQLLAPAVVGTVDQVLRAATRSKYVALRHAGLLGKVLVIDEVHAYDAHMGVFLEELLRWSGRMRIPVVLMSATLPPSLRTRLVDAWRQGRGLACDPLPPPSGYPTIVALTGEGDVREQSCAPRSGSQVVVVDVLAGDVEDMAPVARSLADEVQDGGCALAICNTVRRAQDLYQQLVDEGVPAVLLHGRLTVAERARRTAEILALMGPEGTRPERLVVVATQIAEQSFDVDADVLYTDAAPMDLLLQRVGRLHRHAGRGRPARHTSPRVVVTGLDLREAPRWNRAFAPRPDEDLPTEPRTVYRTGLMLATASALVGGARWNLPADIPSLVATAYSDTWTGPEEWSEWAATAALQVAAETSARQARAATFRLDEFPDAPRTTLEGLHERASDAEVFGVREGDDTTEVVLVVQDEGRIRTVGGRDLGSHGERAASPALAREVLGDAVRLRWADDVSPFPGWATLPWLEGMPVVVLDGSLSAVVSGRVVRYDPALGLVDR